MSEAVAKSSNEQADTARARLTSCLIEIRRLRGMKWRRAWTRSRINGELKLMLPLLRLRERIPDIFWRIFVLVIGTSAFVAIAFLATRHATTTAQVVATTATIAAAAFTLLVLLPTDALLHRRRLVLSQVAASADYEHQNVCSQLDFLRQRRDAVKKQLKLMQQDNGSNGQHTQPPIPPQIPQPIPQPEPQSKTVQPETHP